MCSMELPIFRHGANTRAGDLMANIAEMVKQLQEDFSAALDQLQKKAGTVSGWTSPFRVSLFIVAGTHADGSPRTDRLIEASIQWAERIMRKIDPLFGAEVR